MSELRKKGTTRDTTKIRWSAPPVMWLPRCRLEVIGGPNLGEVATMETSTLRVGSGEQNDLSLDDHTVSQTHLLIERTREGYLLRDLGSTNGTQVNELRVEETLLPAGSEIQVGQSRLRFRTYEEELVLAPHEGGGLCDLVGENEQMTRLFSQIDRVAATDLPVLIEGETGVGKELVARAIHALSRRCRGPFQVFDCGTVDRESFRSDLFGHERGAYTGASEARQGAFQLANGGTLLFDELGEVRLSQQSKLLRSLESGEIWRMGSEQARKVDVRFIAATHRNLEAMVAAGTFREDLFFRLSVIRLTVPPLRERRDDIPRLARHFLAQQRQLDPASRVKAITPEAMRLLEKHSWPGNVRELRNTILASLALAPGSSLEPGDLRLRKSTSGEHLAPRGGTLREAEQRAIELALAEHDWKMTTTAEQLGISRTTLRKKIREYGITRRS